MKSEYRDVIKAPIITEKSAALAAKNILNSTKESIKKAEIISDEEEDF